MYTDPRNSALLVKEIRRQLALSWEDLALRRGVSYATINRWVNGQPKPPKLLFYDDVDRPVLRAPEMSRTLLQVATGINGSKRASQGTRRSGPHFPAAASPAQ